MIVLRLTCSACWVDVRLREMNGRWIASADTPDGPSLGLGELAIEAIEAALGAIRADSRRAARQRASQRARLDPSQARLAHLSRSTD